MALNQRSPIQSRGLATLVALLALLLAVSPGHAAELLMFEEPGCPWCKRWEAEVGIGYARSAEGQRAPVRRLPVGKPPGNIQLHSPVTMSPTFVLVEDGREVGRITGYPGADFFWALLGELVAKLDRKPQGSG